MYYSISKFLKDTFDVDLDPSFIFHLLGGHAFNYTKIENDKIPNYMLRSNIINYDNLKINAGFSFLKKENADIHYITNNLKTGEQLILTNCYYLPYDKINFKTSYDNHLVIVKEYDYSQKVFTVTDANHEDEKIDLIDLNKSYINVVNSNPIHFEVFKEASVNYTEKVLNIAIQNHQVFLTRDYPRLLNFKNEIMNVLNTNNIYREISLMALAKSLKHAHGPITIKKMLHQSYKKLLGDLYGDLYLELSMYWEVFFNKLLRLKENNIDSEEVIDYYDYLLKSEFKTNKIMQKLLNQANMG